MTNSNNKLLEAFNIRQFTYLLFIIMIAIFTIFNTVRVFELKRSMQNLEIQLGQKSFDKKKNSFDTINDELVGITITQAEFEMMLENGIHQPVLFWFRPDWNFQANSLADKIDVRELNDLISSRNLIFIAVDVSNFRGPKIHGIYKATNTHHFDSCLVMFKNNNEFVKLQDSLSKKIEIEGPLTSNGSATD